MDYQGKLSLQNLSEQHLVVYNASGTNISAACIDRNQLSFSFVVDHKLYWCACFNQEEADYLVAILNSGTVNERIKPFQSMGLMGERDVHKKPLELPFPVYNPSNGNHQKLSFLGKEARLIAKKVSSSYEMPSSLAKQRNFIREHLSSTLDQIDQLVFQLINI